MKSLTLLILSAALVVAGCATPDAADNAAPAPAVRSVRVETMRLAPTSFDDVIEVTGTVEATDDAILSAQSSGTVLTLAALGANIGSGGVVAQLDPGVLQAGVAQAQALVQQAESQLALAEDNFRRQQGLYRDSIISALEFESIRTQRATAQASVAQARAGLSQAQATLRNTRVVTPFSGRVEEHFVQRGEQVTPGRQIARVVSTGRVKVTAGVPERFAGDIRQGATVDMRFSAFGGELRTGRITFVGSAVDPASRTFPVEVELGNPDGRLKPQMVASLLIPRARIENALVIPREAILRDERGTSVYVAVRNDGGIVAQRRTVEVGPGSGGRVVIESGLEAGDEVIVLGQTNLTDGERLDVANTRTPVAANQ